MKKEIINYSNIEGDYMKKIMAIAITAIFMSTSLAFGFSLGAKGSLNMGLGTTYEGDSSSEEIKGNVGAGLGAYVNFGLLKFGSFGLGIQPEVDLNFNNGWNYTYSTSSSLLSSSTSTKVSSYTNTLDIPVLVTLDIPLSRKFILGVGVGPMISFPLVADGTSSNSSSILGIDLSLAGSYSDSLDVSAKPNFGMALDVNGKICFGKLLRLVIDLRYNLDFTATEFTFSTDSSESTSEQFTRRGMNLGLGLEVGL